MRSFLRLLQNTWLFVLPMLFATHLLALGAAAQLILTAKLTMPKNTRLPRVAMVNESSRLPIIAVPAITEAQMVASHRSRLVATLLARFPKAQGMVWRVHDSMYHVSFAVEGIKTRAVYSADGIFSYGIAYYAASQVPASFTSPILQRYHGWQIHHATEVITGNGSVFDVVLENKTSFLTIQLADDGTMEELRRIRKAF